jgi:type IV pilus assembly protein PilV
MVMASRSSHAAYLRTQVTFLASNMANRMSANSAAVWKGAYNSGSYPLVGTDDHCADGSPCNAQALAAHDQTLWSRQLTTFLPSPRATIQCSAAGAGGMIPTPDLRAKPPYGGNCMMTISWIEQGAGDTNHRGNGVQTLAWSFQP